MVKKESICSLICQGIQGIASNFRSPSNSLPGYNISSPLVFLRGNNVMQKILLSLACIAALMFFLSCVGNASAASDPKPLPNNIIFAWEKAGAQFGWLNLDEQGEEYLTVGSLTGQPGEIPEFNFSFQRWTPGVFGQLPAPNQNFGLDLSASDISDTDLVELSRFTHLQILNLTSTQVTDAGLKQLLSLTQLKTLGLSDTHVTDAGLKTLASLKQLQDLDLSNRYNQVTDAGLKELVSLTQLQRVTFYNDFVTDVGLKELAGLTLLQSLNLMDTKVTDTGLKELAGLKRLQDLDLTDTNITDVGLKTLAGLTQLKWLILVNTHVTDAGLKELAGLKHLYSLDISGTQVTDAGMIELQKALPDALISR
jgi:Leucine-rich repeat (LRR) protein